MAKKGKRFKQEPKKNKREHEEKELKNIRKSRKARKQKKRRTIGLLFMIFFFTLIFISSINIISWLEDNKKNQKVINEISNKIIVDERKDIDDIEKYTVKFRDLKNENKDTVAWLRINGTQIDYPVVKSKDNSYYLTHSFDKTNNGVGWIFADYRNKFDGTDKNIIIYGHNRRDNTMFGTLKNTLEEKWYKIEENRKIHFITENENSIYEVFSIYKVESEDYYIQTDFEGNSFKEFVQTIKNRSIKDFGIQVREDDKILTLSTCDNNNKYRVVVHSKKVK